MGAQGEKGPKGDTGDVVSTLMGLNELSCGSFILHILEGDRV